MKASEARRAASRAAKKAEKTRQSESDLALQAALETVPGLMKQFQAKADEAIKEAVKDGKVETGCYLGSWNWTDPASSGAPIAARRLVDKLVADGYVADTDVRSAHRHTDGDGYPQGDEGSTGVSIMIKWADEEEE